MERYIMFFKFTDKGIGNVQDSPKRAEALKEIAEFRTMLEKMPKF